MSTCSAFRTIIPHTAGLPLPSSPIQWAQTLHTSTAVRDVHLQSNAHTPILLLFLWLLLAQLTVKFSSYLAFLRVITLVALWTFPAVGQFIIEQPFPIHLQMEDTKWLVSVQWPFASPCPWQWVWMAVGWGVDWTQPEPYPTCRQPG